eukprot:gene12919-biopygen10352
MDSPVNSMDILIRRGDEVRSLWGWRGDVRPLAPAAGRAPSPAPAVEEEGGMEEGRRKQPSTCSGGRRRNGGRGKEACSMQERGRTKEGERKHAQCRGKEERKREHAQCSKKEE